MRQPTSDPLLAWRERLEGKEHPLIEWWPEPGFYKCRAWSKGPLVPGRIWLVSPTDPITGELIADEYHRAEVAGYPIKGITAWHRMAGAPITKDEWKFLTAQLSLKPIIPKWIPPGMLKPTFTSA